MHSRVTRSSRRGGKKPGSFLEPTVQGQLPQSWRSSSLLLRSCSNTGHSPASDGCWRVPPGFHPRCGQTRMRPLSASPHYGHQRGEKLFSLYSGKGGACTCEVTPIRPTRIPFLSLRPQQKNMRTKEYRKQPLNTAINTQITGIYCQWQLVSEFEAWDLMIEMENTWITTNSIGTTCAMGHTAPPDTDTRGLRQQEVQKV